MRRVLPGSLALVLLGVLAACGTQASPAGGTGSIATPEPATEPAAREAEGSAVAGPALVRRAQAEGSWQAGGATAVERVERLVASGASPVVLEGVRIADVRADGDRTLVRAQQLLNGVVVDGHSLLFTIEGEKVTSVRGYYLEGVRFAPAQLTWKDAVGVALVHTGLDALVSGELPVPDGDGIIRVGVAGESDGLADEGALTIASEQVVREVAGKAILAWKVELGTMVTKPIVYVDAHSGEVVLETNAVRHAVGTGDRLPTDQAPATSVSFGVSTTTGGYRLLAPNLGTTGAASVRTLNATLCRGGNFICYSEVTSSTTNFSAADDRFTTAHYYAEQVIEFLESYGLNSYDNKGAALTVYTLRDGNNYDNAFYSGTNYVLFGDGSYDSSTGNGEWTPLVHAGVIAHEIGHAVDAKSGGNFDYVGESGALSESWADMQGYRFRDWKLGDGAAHLLGADFTPGNWHNEEGCGTSGVAPASDDCGVCAASTTCGDGDCVGNEVCAGAGLDAPATECLADCGNCTGGAAVAGDGVCDHGNDIGGDGHHAYLRNMADPMQAHQPDTYGGGYWVPVVNCAPSSSNDNCGVHTNSGVGNKWFTLLAAATNSDKAYRIALDTVRTKSTSTDTYADFAANTTASAAGLYGAGSAEATAVAAAWAAVGIGCASDADCEPAADACGAAETCVAGVCQPGTPVTCADDGNACTVEACNPADGTCGTTAASCGASDGCCVEGCSDPDCPTAGGCGNAVCEGGGENCSTCASDCGCKGKNCSKGCCGDGACTGVENATSCPVDC